MITETKMENEIKHPLLKFFAVSSNIQTSSKSYSIRVTRIVTQTKTFRKGEERAKAILE